MMKEKTWEKIHKVFKWILFFGWGAMAIFSAVTKTEQPWQSMCAVSYLLLMMYQIS